MQSQSFQPLLRFGSVFRLLNQKTEAVLAYNANERILGEDTHPVTTTKKSTPAGRNIFRVESDNGSDQNTAVTYGQKLRLTTDVNGTKYYLQSLIVTPTRSSKLSRGQEVSVTKQRSSSSLWVLEHIDPKERFNQVGQPVSQGASVLVQHCATNKWLASTDVEDINDYGREFEVFAKSFVSSNKTHNLFAEKVGHRTVDFPMRTQGIENAWSFLI